MEITQGILFAKVRIMIFPTFFFTLLLQALFVDSSRRYQTLRLEIPWPSGIQIDKVPGSQQQTFRFGRLQHNAISLRPGWDQIHSVEGVLTPDSCADIVEKAELYAAKFGWSKGRHVDYDIRPTKDLPVEVIFESEAELDSLFARFRLSLLPRIAEYFGLDAEQIRPTDLFITKYNASHAVERQLALHKDKSPWSFVIALNDDYSGGGTFFDNDQSLRQAGVGGAVVFNGNQLHGANAITTGVRYILAGFCEYGEVFPLQSTEGHEAFMASYDPLYDGHAAEAGFRSGDLIVGIEACEMISDVCDVEKEVCTGLITSRVVRKRLDVTGFTSNGDWQNWAQSCELLEPASKSVLWVRRNI